MIPKKKVTISMLKRWIKECQVEVINEIYNTPVPWSGKFDGLTTYIYIDDIPVKIFFIHNGDLKAKELENNLRDAHILHEYAYITRYYELFFDTEKTGDRKHDTMIFIKIMSTLPKILHQFIIDKKPEVIKVNGDGDRLESVYNNPILNNNFKQFKYYTLRIVNNELYLIRKDLTINEMLEHINPKKYMALMNNKETITSRASLMNFIKKEIKEHIYTNKYLK